MCQTVLFASCVVLACVSRLASAANFKAPLVIGDSLTYYIVNEQGGDFTVSLRWRDPYQADMDRPLLVRVFDPEEHLIVRHDDPGERTVGDVPDHAVELKIRGAGAGVYQVIVTAFAGDVSLGTVPEMPWGVYGYPQLTAHPGQLSESFIFLPPGMDRFPIRCRGTIESLVLADEAGAPRMTLRDVNPSAEVAVDDAAGQVWKLTLDAATDVQLNFGGMPIVLCPDTATARAIHSSVDVLDDGTVCFHKFQSRIHEVLKKYRAMPPSAFAVKPPVLSRLKNLWLENPVRNSLLLGPYGVYSALDVVLREQNVDGSSPWFGAIQCWRAPGEGARPENPWTAYDRLGMTNVAKTVSILGAVYSIKDKLNPLAHDEALRNRIIVASLQELMMLREHEMPMPEFDSYLGGARVFVFGPFMRTLPWVIRDCPADVQSAWREGVMRYADRMTMTQVASVVNQWAFGINGLQHVADGTGDPFYATIVQRQLRWLLTCNQWNRGCKPAGYFDEDSGPDATYVGITTVQLAYVFEQTKDKSLLAALRRCVDLFNHTIAPEPDGTWRGVSSFSHRTPGDWTEPQWGGGLGMLADDFPEAAPHLGRAWMAMRAPQDSTGLAAAEQEVSAKLAYLNRNAFADPTIGPIVLTDGPEIAFANWEYFAETPRHGTLPMQASERFTRNFGEEFFCVRRPSYYAFIYAGNTMDPASKAYRPQDAHLQHPRNGGGLCMFWSPSFGSSILAKNCSAYAAQTIIAEHNGTGAPGGADWEDYWSVKNVFDETTATAVIEGRLRDQPIAFTRQWSFLDTHLECELTLKADADVRFSAMWECFPYPLDKLGGMKVTLLDEDGAAVANRPASAILFSARGAEAHLIVFDHPRLCEPGTEKTTDNYKQTRENGRVLAQLPTTWKAGQSHMARWCMMAIRPGEAAQVVKQAIEIMKQH